MLLVSNCAELSYILCEDMLLAIDTESLIFPYPMMIKRR